MHSPPNGLPVDALSGASHPCPFGDVRMSSTHVSLPDELALALAWLVGHGLHAAIVVLLPVAYYLLGRPGAPAGGEAR